MFLSPEYVNLFLQQSRKSSKIPWRQNNIKHEILSVNVGKIH